MAVMPERRAMPPMPPQGSPLIDSVLWYAEVLGWPMFPLAPASKAPLFKSPHDPGDPCRGECGKVGHGLHDATTHLETLRAWWGACPTANIGFALPAWLIAVDVDNGEKKHGLEAFARLEAEHGCLPVSVTNFTGSGNGSKHILLRVPEGIPLRGTLGEDIDIKKQGGYLVLPPSKHPDTGLEYSWKTGPDAQDYGPDKGDPQPAPLWLMTLLQTTGKATNGAGTAYDPAAVIKKGDREKTLTRIGGGMRRNGAGVGEIRAAFDAINQRMEPPLSAADLDRVAKSMGRYDPAPPEPELIIPRTETHIGWSMLDGGKAANEPTASDEPTQPPASHLWLKQLFANRDRTLKQNITNVMLTFENHPHWQQPANLLWWDSVRGRAKIGSKDIDDQMVVETCDWFGRHMNLPMSSTDMLSKTIVTRCKKQERDLLKEWLNELPPWDGTERLTTWLQTVGGAEECAYAKDVSRVLPVSMVARALHPGCHYRFVVILYGAQDIGKSLLIKALSGPEWYVDLGLNLESKEAHMMLQGVWVAELGELHSMTHTEETRLKSFITMDEDSYVPKYGNFRETTQRRAIFVGTTNRECFLKDDTGNTRFLPIELRGECDLEGFRFMRDQLFAEAKRYYEEHQEDWWDLSDEGHEQARERRELHRVPNPYEQRLHEWLTYERMKVKYYTEGSTEAVVFIEGETCWAEIAEFCLKLKTPADWKDKSLQMQVSSALRALGWKVGQVWRFGKNQKMWRLDNTLGG